MGGGGPGAGAGIRLAGEIVLRTAVVLVASLLAVAGLGGCGSSSSSRPGCSSFCQQAGASAGDESGINTPAPGCPPLGSGASIHYCIEQVGSTAVARKGVFRIGVRCNSAAPCVGAFVVYSERDLTIKGRFAGSDFRVSPKTTATIEVALTKVGEETLRREPQRAATFLWLQRPGHRLSFGFGGAVMISQAK